MENRRMMLIALLGVIAYFIYQAWQHDHRLPLVPPAQAVAEVSEAAAGATGQIVRVVTDLQTAEIQLRGGDLHRLMLNHYPVTIDKPDDKLALLDDRDGQWSVFQTGLAGSEQPFSGPDSVYTATQLQYALADGQDSVDVPLVLHGADGVEVRKTYRFHRGSYVVDVEQTLVNGSAAPIKANAYARFVRLPVEARGAAPFMQPFMGYGVYEQKTGSSNYRFKKFAFKDLGKEPFEFKQQGGWIVMLQHYFLAAILPPPDEALTLTGKSTATVAGAYTGQYLGSAQDIAPGKEHAFPLRLYVGPESQGGLDAIAPGLEYTEDYGILTPVAKPLFWILKTYNKWVGNWGVAIILLTLTVKLAFYKLSEAQYRSAAKMRKFGPRLQELKERYGDDREKYSKAMTDLYKKEGFNPLAGCWPMLVQMPVFFALYWVVGQSVELRHAPFCLWLNDLSAADPYFVLPVLYGASMWLQQKMSGQAATMDPMQAKMMNVMPVFLAGMFAFVPSALVLYWVSNNTMGIAQQWFITRRIDAENKT